MDLLQRRFKPEGETDLSRTISNSEVSTFTQCERRHYYGYLKTLEPVNTSTSRSRGIIGHEALAFYYDALKEGVDPATAQQRALDCVGRYLHVPNADTVMLTELMQLLIRYFGYYSPNEFLEILAVEKVYEIDAEEFIYGMRLDLLVRDKAGKIVLIDHKFVYDFYTQNIIDTNAQLPKYVGTLKMNGVPVDYAILNQVRYRLKKGGNTDDELFKRAVVRPNHNRIKRIMGEQFSTSRRILARRALAPDRQDAEAIRTMNQMTCKNCPFLNLCTAELDGQPVDNLIQTDFRPNAYALSYNPEGDE